MRKLVFFGFLFAVVFTSLTQAQVLEATLRVDGMF